MSGDQDTPSEMPEDEIMKNFHVITIGPSITERMYRIKFHEILVDNHTFDLLENSDDDIANITKHAERTVYRNGTSIIRVNGQGESLCYSMVETSKVIKPDNDVQLPEYGILVKHSSNAGETEVFYTPTHDGDFAQFSLTNSYRNGGLKIATYSNPKSLSSLNILNAKITHNKIRDGVLYESLRENIGEGIFENKFYALSHSVDTSNLPSKSIRVANFLPKEIFDYITNEQNDQWKLLFLYGNWPVKLS